MTTKLTIRFQLPGFHRFENVVEVYPDNREIWFLGQDHRHIFHFECTFPVMGHDRELEFFLLQESVKKWIFARYDGPFRKLDFGSRSCEMIAESILKAFPLMDSCTVTEDGENGATVTR